MDYDRVVRAYLAIRDKRTEIKRAFDDEDNLLKEKAKTLENALLKHLQDTGLESAKTSAGTFYRQEDLKPSASDWDLVYQFIKDNDAFEMLERRLKKDFVKEYLELHGGELPPGTSIHREFVVRVRRA